jgi:malate synthase
MERQDRHGLQVDARMVAFVEGQALPGTGIDPDRFWQGLAEAVDAAAP